MLQHYLQHTENRKPIWPKGLSMMFFWSDLQMLLWPWLLTSWPPKVDHFIPWPVDHLCQLASKSVFTHFQNIVLSVHKLVSTNGWTERQKYISLSEKEMTSYVSRWTLKPARSLTQCTNCCLPCKTVEIHSKNNCLRMYELCVQQKSQVHTTELSGLQA